jgi:hypothetical protein
MIAPSVAVLAEGSSMIAQSASENSGIIASSLAKEELKGAESPLGSSHH